MVPLGIPIEMASLPHSLRRFDSGVQASFVVALHYLTPEHPTCTYTTAVGPLRTGETHFRPSQRLLVGIKQGVFLLDSEPRVRGFHLSSFHDFLTGLSSIGGARFAVVC